MNAPAARPRRQEQEEATEEITEVAPGVVRLQLPVHLPGLGHVNCYVLEDERGIAVVDPGLPGDPSWEALVDRLGRAGYKVTDVHTAVITHSHFDHFGGGPRLAEEAGAEIVTHELFRAEVRGAEMTEEPEPTTMLTDSEITERIERIFSQPLPWGTRRTPPPPEQIAMMKRMGRFTNSFMRTPEPTITVTDTEVVRLGRREWVAVHTPGHTADHLCLYDPEHRVMLSGDHVLPTITPHITGLSSAPDPLAQFFTSLTAMETYTDVAQVLPAHGHPFTDLAGRARSIKVHHEERLSTVRQTGAKLGSSTVTAYMRALFSERAWGDMAESETFAHLEHLRILGEMAKKDVDGIAHYAPAESS